VIAARGGADRVYGGAGEDTIHAGAGSDVAYGGAGNDLLIGDGPEEIVFKTDLLTMAESRTVKVTFDSEEAGYRNTLGVYKVDPKTGAMTDVKVMFENASLQGSGGDLIGGQSSFGFDVQAGDKIGFFLIGDGASSNNFAKLGAGTYKFVDQKGNAATVDSVGAKMVHVSPKGVQTPISGPVYHTAGFGDRAKLNADGIEHTMGYKKNDNGAFQIGFEDLWKGGDRDFDDSVFTVDIGKASVEVLNKHYETVLKAATSGTQVASYSKMQAETAHDRLEGGSGADTLQGMQGNDLLAGNGAGTEWKLVNGSWVYNPAAVKMGTGYVPDKSDDDIQGGSGGDVLLGGGGNDKMDGGGGNDTLNAGVGDDIAMGGAGNDILNLEAGNDFGEGGDGNDVINAGAGDDVAHGDAGDDSLRGDLGNDKMFGGAGKDELTGGVGDDSLDGGDGDDKLFGGEGKDLLTGGAGADHLEGAAGDDALDGGEGVDKLFGGDGRDKLVGGAGADTLDGGIGDDALDGGDGDDRMLAGDGDDILSGGAGKDVIVGGKGNDLIQGGKGTDELWGGNWSADGARDIFAHAPGGGRDIIQDFEIKFDQIDLSAYGLSYHDLASRMVDKGWATEIDLSGLSGASMGDALVLKSIKVAALTEDKFIF
jgi:serralysin